MTARPPRAGGGRPRPARGRLAAVQALYRVGLTGDDVERAIADLTRRKDGPRMDVELFGSLARGAAAGRGAADPAIAGVLAEGWRIERLSETMRALLRVAAFEAALADAPPVEILVNEYVDIAAGFFDEKEIGFVNGAVDRLAREARAAKREWTNSR